MSSHNKGLIMKVFTFQSVSLFIINLSACFHLIFLYPLLCLSYFPVPNKCPSKKCCESLPCPSWERSHPLSCCVLPIKVGSHCLSSGLAAPGTAAPARPHCDFRPHTDGPASKYSCTWLDAAPVGVAEWTWRSAHRPPRVLGVGGADRAQMLR